MHVAQCFLACAKPGVLFPALEIRIPWHSCTYQPLLLGLSPQGLWGLYSWKVMGAFLPDRKVMPYATWASW